MTLNLRNHRKLLALDGQTAFTGGMNIRHGNMLSVSPRGPVQDLQFRVEGPLVAQLQAGICQRFGRSPPAKRSMAKSGSPNSRRPGNVIARAIPDGPDTDFDKARWTLLAALGEAPDLRENPHALFFAGQLARHRAQPRRAARRARGHHSPREKQSAVCPLASRAMWWQMLERGCHVWLTPPPFDHSKLMIVDNHWVLFGSANWDARSLRLNFELNVECYGREFGARDGGGPREKTSRRARSDAGRKWTGDRCPQNCATPSRGCFRRIYESIRRGEFHEPHNLDLSGRRRAPPSEIITRT